VSADDANGGTEIVEAVTSAGQMQEIALGLKRRGLSIGLVPTMGCLHRGHLSLVQAARSECDRVVMSIFVNPLQFGQQEDFSAYPREPERDLDLAREEGVDFVFAPTGDSMYPEGFSTNVEVGGTLTAKMCARSRPGHFRGVTTVVMKLFQIVQPDRAYFGQKDAQQALVIRKMAADLNLPVEIVTCPIVRDADGLALSSRNVYLSPEERKTALALPRSLDAGRALILRGERRVEQVYKVILEVLADPAIRVDYVDVCDGHTLADLSEIQGTVLLAAAVWVGKTRLIDNIYLNVQP
jgi:pantoate--beta-alanine ligase